MKKRCLKRTLALVLIVSFIDVSAVLAQESWREKIRERRKQRIEKKLEETARSQFGLGGEDYRMSVTWIRKPGDYGPGDYGRKIESQGLTRFYKFHVPSSYRKDQPMPVVLVFHGGGGYPGAVRYQTDFDKVADKKGFIVVFPAGHHRIWKDRLLFWNDGRTPKNDPSFSKVDDVGFVDALLNDLTQFFNVDEDRIYATGLSNGSEMTYRLACELSDRIAAIAPVGGQRAIGEYGQTPPKAISLIHFHGKLDNWAKYDGGAPPSSFFKGKLKPVLETIQTWISHNECSSESVETRRIDQAIITHYGPGKSDTEVILVTLEDGGHTWPGGKMTESERDYLGIGTGPINQDISAMEMMWEFFKKHPKKQD
jgi:polyhydroxybutyrate depolymerase